MKKNNVWNRLHIVEIVIYLFMSAGIALVLAGLVLRAVEVESDWRADRMYQQGYYDDPGAGP